MADLVVAPFDCVCVLLPLLTPWILPCLEADEYSLLCPDDEADVSAGNLLDNVEPDAYVLSLLVPPVRPVPEFHLDESVLGLSLLP